MKKCPFCSEEIQDSAKKCRHCGEWLETENAKIDKHGLKAKINDFLGKISFKGFLNSILSILRKFVGIIVFLIVVYGINFFYGGQSDAYKKAHTLLTSKDYVSALIEYNKYIEKYPDDYKGYNDKSLILFEDRKYEDALRTINSIDLFKINTNNQALSIIESNKCLFYYSLMKYDLAKEACQKSLQYSPKNTLALLNSATLYMALAEYSKSLNYANDSIKHWDQIRNEEAFEIYGIDQAYNIKGLVLHNLGKNDEALDYLNKAINLNSNNAYAYNNKALILTKQGKNDEALININKAISIETREGIMYQVKGYILSELGKNDEAITYYDKALKFNPDDFVTNYTKAISLFALGKYSEALDISIKANSMKYSPSESSYINENIAIQCISLVALERYSEGLKACDNFLNKYLPDTSNDTSTYVMVLDYKGIALTLLDRTNEARKIFQEVLKISPDDEIANKALN